MWNKVDLHELEKPDRDNTRCRGGAGRVKGSINVRDST